MKWEKVLNEEIPIIEWQVIRSQVAKSSMCTLYKENSYKILLFWYMTPDVLHAIFLASSDRCWRCQGARGTFLHIYWSWWKSHLWRQQSFMRFLPFFHFFHSLFNLLLRCADTPPIFHLLELPITRTILDHGPAATNPPPGDTSPGDPKILSVRLITTKTSYSI